MGIIKNYKDFGNKKDLAIYENLWNKFNYDLKEQKYFDEYVRLNRAYLEKEKFHLQMLLNVKQQDNGSYLVSIILSFLGILLGFLGIIENIFVKMIYAFLIFIYFIMGFFSFYKFTRINTGNELVLGEYRLRIQVIDKILDSEQQQKTLQK